MKAGQRWKQSYQRERVTERLGADICLGPIGFLDMTWAGEGGGIRG